MSSWIYSYLFILYAIWYIKECHSHYEDYTQNRYRNYLYGMDRELIRDSLQKIRSIQFMRSYYTRSPSFYLAERVFHIRRRFTKMLREYIHVTNVVGNKTHEYKHYFLQERMLKMQKIGMDIDHLVEILTEWEENNSKKLVNIAGFNVPVSLLTPGPNNIPEMANMPSGKSLYGAFQRPAGFPSHPNPGAPPPGAPPPGAPPPGPPGPGVAPGLQNMFGPNGPQPGSSGGRSGIRAGHFG